MPPDEPAHRCAINNVSPGASRGRVSAGQPKRHPIPAAAFQICLLFSEASSMLTTTGAGLPISAPLLKRLGQIAALLIICAITCGVAVAQTGPATAPAGRTAQSQTPQPAPPLPGSAETQMTQGEGPSPQAE